MYDISFAPLSNRASWEFLAELVDEAGDPIDVTGCSIEFQIADRHGWKRLLATTGNGKIVHVDVGKVRWNFTVDDMRCLEPDTYQTGFTVTNDDGTQARQLSVGPLPIVDGVVP